MPNKDGTGPLGMGRVTGRGLGPCGRGMKRGFGRCLAGTLTKDEEKKILENEKEEINKRLEELKK
ncbi:hypothetical protein COX58_00230 [archaeon CG_4_10_14_0_2_um_filter_Archaea_38_6]|nr:MAG: hypothetical protein COS83_02010 [archaeon CG07_land_8_20_14_0_80_38_8]PIU88427.1 MAG: hypothetical protein COS64_03690 [archaeon CG06_land_8_20_14_3_00_37_11]PJA23143.1 MAG: hypothetical protein COX58_00230 [archaeon CG_4_10_14_0_2_um_filter_Archaea_38_6]